MNLNTICSFPGRVLKYGWQTVYQNKKTIVSKGILCCTIVGGGVLCYTALAAIQKASNGRYDLTKMKYNFQDGLDQFKIYAKNCENNGLEQNNLFWSNSYVNDINYQYPSDPGQCHPLYDAYNIEAIQGASTLDSKVKKVYNRVTGSGKDIFSSYEHFVEISCKDSQLKISFTICKKSNTLDDSVNPKIAEISKRISSTWKQVPYNKNVSPFFSSIVEKLPEGTPLVKLFNNSLIQFGQALEKHFMVPWVTQSN